MSSIANIAPVRDLSPIARRNSPRDVVAGSSAAQDGVQNPKAPDASSETKTGNGDANQLGPKRLTADQVRLVQELSQIDQKVRAHETAHQAAAGSLGGAVSFSYQTGPDGKSYAVGGEVPVDMSAGRTPQDTLSKAEQIRSAALAPADPSPQDLSVAAQASQMEAAAREQLMQQQLTAMHAIKAGHAEQTAVLGPQTLRGKAVSLSRSDTSRAMGTGPPGASAMADSNGGQGPASLPGSGASDVGAQASATLATLESDRAAVGVTRIQVQQLARLATVAYGL